MRAREIGRSAVCILTRSGMENGLASTLITFAATRMKQRDLECAGELLVRTIRIKEELSNLHGLAKAHYRLSQICELQGKRDGALRHYLSASFVLDHAKDMESDRRDDEMLRSPLRPDDLMIDVIDFDDRDCP